MALERTAGSLRSARLREKTARVDPRRFELLTSSMRTRRATNCAKGPCGFQRYHPERRALFTMVGANSAGFTRGAEADSRIDRKPRTSHLRQRNRTQGRPGLANRRGHLPHAHRARCAPRPFPTSVKLGRCTASSQHGVEIGGLPGGRLADDAHGGKPVGLGVGDGCRYRGAGEGTWP